MPEQRKNKTAQVFNFSDGCMSDVNTLLEIGEKPDIDAHCSDIDEGLTDNHYILTDVMEDSELLA